MNIKVIFKMVCLLFFGVFCISVMFGGSGGSESGTPGKNLIVATNTLAVYQKDSAAQNIILPFYPVSYCAEKHIMAFFKGDPDYESVEAFIFGKKLENGKPYIMAIMTYHDKHQEDYINDTNVLHYIHGSRKERPLFVSGMDWESKPNNQDQRLKFKLKDGRDIELVYLSDYGVSAQYGGITDIGKHSPDGGFPLFCRDSSGMAGGKSYVMIQGKKYSIPEDEESSKKPFFTGYKSYFTCGMHSMILPIFKLVKNFPPSFVSDSNSMEEKYDGIFSQKILLEKRDGVKEITEAYFSSPQLSPADSVRLRFSPSFPNLKAMELNQVCPVRFDVYFNGSEKEQASGVMLIRKTEADSAVVELNPLKPEYFKNDRRMIYFLKWDNKAVKIESRMNNN